MFGDARGQRWFDEWHGRTGTETLIDHLENTER
jgi:hypothetical protein